MKENKMLSNSLKIVCAMLFSGAILAQTGCACGTAKGCATTKTSYETARVACDTSKRFSIEDA